MYYVPVTAVCRSRGTTCSLDTTNCAPYASQHSARGMFCDEAFSTTGFPDNSDLFFASIFHHNMAAILYWHQDPKKKVGVAKLSDIRPLKGSTVAENSECEADYTSRNKTSSFRCLVLLIDRGKQGFDFSRLPFLQDLGLAQAKLLRSWRSRSSMLQERRRTPNSARIWPARSRMQNLESNQRMSQWKKLGLRNRCSRGTQQ